MALIVILQLECALLVYIHHKPQWKKTVETLRAWR